MVSVCACVLEVKKRGSMLLPLVGGNNLFEVNNLCNFSVGEKSAVPYPGEGLYVLCVCQAHKHEENKPISSFLW